MLEKRKVVVNYVKLFTIQPNAAGERWMELMAEWRTDVTFNPTSPDDTFETRAFKGMYTVDIKVDGDVICSAEKNTQDEEWNIVVEEC